MWNAIVEERQILDAALISNVTVNSSLKHPIKNKNKKNSSLKHNGSEVLCKRIRFFVSKT